MTRRIIMSDVNFSAPKCKEWVRRDNAVIAPCQRLPFYDLVVDQAKGDILVDVDNNTFIDFLSSASSLNIGSRHESVVAAITEQMNKCIQFSPVYSYNVPMIEYAEELVKLFPLRDDDHSNIMISFSNCGSEANDAAIKFARAKTGRSKIIAFTNSYHGNTYGSSTLSACTSKMHEKIGPMLTDIYHFTFFGSNVSDAECEANCLREIEDAFRTYLPADEVAAVIIEPMQACFLHTIFSCGNSLKCAGTMASSSLQRKYSWHSGAQENAFPLTITLMTMHIPMALSWANRSAAGWFWAPLWHARTLLGAWKLLPTSSLWLVITCPAPRDWHPCVI